VSADVFAENRRLGRADVVAGIKAPLLQKGPLSLHPRAFEVSTSNSPIPKPHEGYKTCGPSAHSEQVGIEFFVEHLRPQRDQHGRAKFENSALLRSRWATGLVHTVSKTAVGLERPYVLVHVPSGEAFVAIVVLGPCILGWPLRMLTVSTDEFLLAWVHPLPSTGLTPLFASDPCPVTRSHSKRVACCCRVPVMVEVVGAYCPGGTFIRCRPVICLQDNRH
jgi:hypothetical protein